MTATPGSGFESRLRSAVTHGQSNMESNSWRARLESRSLTMTEPFNDRELVVGQAREIEPPRHAEENRCLADRRLSVFIGGYFRHSLMEPLPDRVRLFNQLWRLREMANGKDQATLTSVVLNHDCRVTELTNFRRTAQVSKAAIYLASLYTSENELLPFSHN